MTASRRSFLAQASRAALALSAVPAPAAAARRIGKIGLQLFTVRDIFAKDPVGTLEQVARIGYREIEFGGGGYDAMDHAMLRRTMDRVGLRSPSVHVRLDALMEKFDDSAKMARTLGVDTMVIPGIGPEQQGEAAWEGVIRDINNVAADLKRGGLGLAYHNHAFEFTVKHGGVTLYERLLQGSNPKLVKLELDLYWAAHGAEDVGALIQRIGPRIYAYHVKDMTADRGMAAVGAGTIDFASLFKLRAGRSVRHFYVENDRAPAPYLPDITASFQALRALRF